MLLINFEKSEYKQNTLPKDLIKIIRKSKLFDIVITLFMILFSIDFFDCVFIAKSFTVVTTTNVFVIANITMILFVCLIDYVILTNKMSMGRVAFDNDHEDILKLVNHIVYFTIFCVSLTILTSIMFLVFSHFGVINFNDINAYTILVMYIVSSMFALRVIKKL